MTDAPLSGETKQPGRVRMSGTRPVSFPLLLAAGAIACLSALPVVYLFVRSAERGLAAYVAAVFTSRTLDLVVRTLTLVGAVALLAVAIAVPAAWLVARTDLRGRGAWGVLLALPLVFPSYVAAFSFVSVFGPRGLLTQFIGAERLPELAYGFSGALITLALFSYPYIFLLLVPALRQLDPSLEESSRTLGRSALSTFFSVILPQLRRPLAGGTLLVILYTLSDFGAVSIVRYDTFTTSIYDAYRGLFDRTVAASLGSVVVVLTLLFVALEWRVASGSRSVRNQASRAPRPVPLGRSGVLALGFLFVIVTLGFVVPSGSIVAWGFRALAMQEMASPGSATLLNALSVSLASALVAMALSIPVAIAATRHRTRLTALIERVTYSGYALPGLIIALSLVFFATRFATMIYQTVILLVIAYVIRFLPEAVTATGAALSNVSIRFEEAARSLGRTPFVVFRTVTIPMVRGGVLAGGGLVFLTAMKELPATLILRPTGFDTLATRIWTATSEASYSDAALPALLLVISSGVPLYTLVIRPALRIRS